MSELNSHRDGTCHCDTVTCSAGCVGAEQGHCECGDAPTEATAAECLKCGYTGEREMVIGETAHASKWAIDECPRCSSHDARWMDTGA